MSKVFFVADTHFGHSNIVKGCSEWDDLSGCRDFKSLKAHDTALVKSINQTVGYNDILYHLGDWSFGGEESIWKFRRQIHCEVVHLCLGNHDHHIKRNKVLTTDSGLINARDLFTTVQDRIEKVIGGRYDFVLDHYAIKNWHKMAKGAIHLYGHSHRELNYNPHAICVSIECHPKFRPFSLEEILHIIKLRNREIND